MKTFFFFILLVSFSLNSIAQSDYAIFRDNGKITDNDSGRLSLLVDNLNYLRNYEYFGDIPLSYTLIGYQFIPQLKFQFNKNFSVKGGIFLRREFGRNGFVSVAPTLTARYQQKSFSILLGTLEGSLNHRFVEPIYNFESIISDRIEQGAQVIVDKKNFWLDWYIDWEKAIKQNDPYREEFTSGVSTRLYPFRNDQFEIAIPLQAMVAHKGGQIDTSNKPVESLLNTAAGISVKYNTGGGFLKGINTEHYFVYYKDISGEKLQLYKEGKGYYSSLTFKSAINLDLDLRYWKGNKFIGPRGGPLYKSVSEKIPGYGEVDRELLFFNVIYNKQFNKSVAMDLRMEPYYDLRNKFFEYGYSVFLRFNHDFFLKRIQL